jgi:hypothetical protein
MNEHSQARPDINFDTKGVRNFGDDIGWQTGDYKRDSSSILTHYLEDTSKAYKRTKSNSWS